MKTNDFYLDFNVTGGERKRLVQAISAYTQASARYLGAPTFSYQVDYFTIDKNGVVSFDGRADSKEIEGLIEALAGQGFTARNPGSGCEEEEVPARELSGEPVPDSAAQEGDTLTIQMPAAEFTPDALNNLHNLIAAKGRLIRKAIGAEGLPVETGPDVISFPWFESRNLDPGEVKAYTHLIVALCDMARKQKRVAAREKDTENDKYAFRCFLLRLGFVGVEFKDERKILLRNLTGSSAFKSGQRRTEPLQPEPPVSAAAVEVQGNPELAEALADELLIQQVNASFGEEAAL